MRNLIERNLNPDFCRQVDAGIPQAEIEKHIRYLCEEIGVRMPGTPEEKRSAEYCASVVEDMGFDVQLEEIPYLAWAADATRVEMVTPEAKPLASIWFSYTLPTPPDGITAPVAYVGMENEEDWSDAAGKIAIVGRRITTSPGRRDLIGRAHAVGAVGYLEFCTAIPRELAKIGNGASTLVGRPEPIRPPDLPPVPAASIAMAHVEEIQKLMGEGIVPTLRLVVGPKDGKLQVWRSSTNVIGTVPGTDLADEIVYVIGHHDANMIGAHDNASGAAAVMAMGRWIKESGYRPRRTIRLFMPGCEQFGMVGSRQHVMRNPDVMKRTVFAMDWGAIGDGDAMWVDRTPDIGPLFDHILETTGYSSRIPTVTQPPAVASDHAGFLWKAGIPACELHFREFRYLFTKYDDPEHISMDRARQSAVLGILAALGFANQGVLPLDFAACAAELRRTVQGFSGHPDARYRRTEMEGALSELEEAGKKANALAERLEGSAEVGRLNGGLRAAAQAVDPRMTGEFKLLPALQRLLGDHKQVSEAARQLPRRLIERTGILQEMSAQREMLVEETKTEVSGILSTLNEAASTLESACKDL